MRFYHYNCLANMIELEWTPYRFRLPAPPLCLVFRALCYRNRLEASAPGLVLGANVLKTKGRYRNVDILPMTAKSFTQ